MVAGHFGIPGQSAVVSTAAAELFWGSDDNKRSQLMQHAVISSAARDDTNTPTTTLRPGLLLGKVTSSGELAEWDPDATDGTEHIYGVLPYELDMLDGDGTAVDRHCAVIVRAPVRHSALRIEGTALEGDTDEYLARRQMASQGFVFDDDPQNFKAGLVERQSVKATSYTVVAADNGTRFYAITADATFTLPAIKAGLEFEFIRASDHEMVVASAEGDNMVVGNDLSADSVTYTTAGQQIGAGIRVKGVYLNGTLKWLVDVATPPYSTGSQMALSIAT